uniref:Uncharacterized protein n=1 Tax=Moschus moschiferus TaxID=68415 RepID=A0A8C6CN02_MOSMO
VRAPKPDGIRKYVWLACLVGLFITGILSLGCNSLNVRLRTVTCNSFPIIACLQESKAFELPQEILSHTQPLKRNIKEAFYEMSRRAFHIFTQDTFKTTWKRNTSDESRWDLITSCSACSNAWKNTREREEPLSAREETLRRPSGAPVLQPGNLELRRYFSRIDRFPKDKKRSHCAWETVQVGIRRCFYFFQKVTALLRRR